MPEQKNLAVRPKRISWEIQAGLRRPMAKILTFILIMVSLLYLFSAEPAVAVAQTTKEQAAKKKLAESIKKLGDENSYARVIAAGDLGQIADTAAVEPLIKTLEDEYWLVRTYAARALGQLGDHRAVVPLAKAMADENEYVRQYAAEALGRIGGKQTIEPLGAALRDENAYVSKVAAAALDLVRKRIAL